MNRLINQVYRDPIPLHCLGCVDLADGEAVKPGSFHRAFTNQHHSKLQLTLLVDRFWCSKNRRKNLLLLFVLGFVRILYLNRFNHTEYSFFLYNLDIFWFIEFAQIFNFLFWYAVNIQNHICKSCSTGMFYMFAKLPLSNNIICNVYYDLGHYRISPVANPLIFHLCESAKCQTFPEIRKSGKVGSVTFWQHLCQLQTRTLFACSGAPKGWQRAAVVAPRGAKRARGPAVTPWLPLTSTRSASGSPPSPRRWRAWTVPTSRPISRRDRPACRPMRSRHSPPLHRRWGAGFEKKIS